MYTEVFLLGGIGAGINLTVSSKCTGLQSSLSITGEGELCGYPNISLRIGVGLGSDGLFLTVHYHQVGILCRRRIMILLICHQISVLQQILLLCSQGIQIVNKHLTQVCVEMVRVVFGICKGAEDQAKVSGAYQQGKCQQHCYAAFDILRKLHNLFSPYFANFSGNLAFFQLCLCRWRRGKISRIPSKIIDNYTFSIIHLFGQDCNKNFQIFPPVYETK